VSVVDDLGAIFEETFAHDPSRFCAETVPDDVKKWDSIGHMSMVAAMEEKFGLQFEVDEIMEMIDVKKILEILDAKGIKD
jgi:acyl carrier protein